MPAPRSAPVLLAQYLVDTFATGFHVPWFNLKDLLITAACKTLTTPLLYTVKGYIPDIIANGLEVMQILVQEQQGAGWSEKKGDVQSRVR